MLQRVAWGLAILSLVARPTPAAEPEFWLIDSEADFLAGEVEGLSVDSNGRLRLSRALTELAAPEAPYVWCLAAGRKDTLYAGTGNEGRVYRIRDGEVSVLYDSEELEVHAIAVGPDGDVYAGTSPDGKVYKISDDGTAEVFYDPSDHYIWGLAFDAKGRLLVTTGLEGRLHRVGEDGEAVILFSSTEAHLTALAVDDRGQAYVGSSPSGVVYRIGTDDAVFALFDSDFREVKALAAHAGHVYAALLEGASGASAAAAPVPAAAAPAAPAVGAEATVTVHAAPAPAPPPAAPPAAGTAKGRVVRIGPGGDVDTVWSSAEESPHSLAWTSQGVLVGTGNKGKVYRVRDDSSWEMLATSTTEQVTAIAIDGHDRTRLATSNPARVLALEDETAQSGRFVSKVQDTRTVSGWGEVRFEAAAHGGQVALSSRSGNTAAPDTTWSDWAPVAGPASGSPIRSERARFLQLEARLTRGTSGSPVLDWISAAYLQRNLKPEIETITVHPPGVVFQRAVVATNQIQVLGLPDDEQPETPKVARINPQQARLIQMSAFSRPLYQRGIQTFGWQAGDANDDDLVYAVDYRAAGDERFRTLREGSSEAVLAWDTSTVPNGRYVIRVRASDSPSNPSALALSASKESAIFWVDNTPPQVEATLEDAKAPRIRAVARDEDSLVAATEYSVDGGRWNEVHPLDGINDSLEESYEIRPEIAAGAGPHVVVVRTRDRLGNVATARVDIP